MCRRFALSCLCVAALTLSIQQGDAQQNQAATSPTADRAGSNGSSRTPTADQSGLQSAIVQFDYATTMSTWGVLANLWPMLNPSEREDFWARMYSGVDEVCGKVLAGRSRVDGPEVSTDRWGFAAVLAGKLLLEDLEFLEAQRLHTPPTDPGDLRNWMDLWDLRRRLVKLDAERQSNPRGQDARQAEREQLVNDIRGRENYLRLMAVNQPAPVPAQVDPEDVAKALRDTDFLIEYVLFHPPVPPQPATPVRNSAHYGAFVIDGADRKIHAVDLGPAEQVDTLIDALANELRAHAATFARGAPSRAHAVRMEAEFNGVTSSVRKLVWDPLIKNGAKPRRVYIVPDGELWRLPFGCLPVSTSGARRYLIEDTAVVVLPTSRALARTIREVAKPGSGAAIFGNPSFNATSAQRRDAFRPVAAAAAPAHDAVGASVPLSSKGALPLMLGAIEGGRPSFEQLSETGKLAERVAARLRAAGIPSTVYSGNGASERQIRAVDSPRILHVATHGYYFRQRSGSMAPTTFSGTAIVLAGANVRDTGGDVDDDGFLLPYEAVDLHLSGTELVTLIACDTGLGTTPPGRGVQGLVSAFARAGASSQLFGLWSVPADETVELTDRFYDRWLAKQEARPEAFEGACQDVIEGLRTREGHAHPFFWGGMVYMGSQADIVSRMSNVTR